MNSSTTRFWEWTVRPYKDETDAARCPRNRLNRTMKWFDRPRVRSISNQPFQGNDLMNCNLHLVRSNRRLLVVLLRF